MSVSAAAIKTIVALSAATAATASIISATRGGGAPRPTRTETAPTPRSTADVESGEQQRASVFRRLSKLRRATLVSERGAAEPQILNVKLGGT